MQVSMQRRPRTAESEPSPPFPDRALAFSAESLPQYFESLALPSAYSLATPTTLARLKLALYSFALSPDSPHRSLFFENGISPALDDVDDDWSLSALQGDGGGEYSESRRGKVCGHVFKSGESVYRCRDCSVDATCVLCSKCFHASSHTALGHDVTLAVHSGSGAGCCDCGDGEAFVEGAAADCRFHSLREGEAVDGQEVSPEAEALKGVVEERLRILLDWMIGVLEDSPTELVAPNSSEGIAALVPSPLCTTRPPPVSTPPPVAESSSSVWNLFSDVSAVARGKAREENAAQEAPFAGPWSVVLWNDEKHSFIQVIDQVGRATGVTKREAADVAQQVDSYGRAVVFTSRDPGMLIFVSRLLSGIDLAVTIRPAIETFYEQISGELIEFMKELCEAKVGGQGGILTEVLAKVMLESSESDEGLSRFQRLVGVDSRLWKVARTSLAEVYVILLGVSPQVKTELSVHFAQIYSSVAESYLLTDREPENSIITFGVQVFTVPSVSAFLVSDHGFLSRILFILYSFFTEQLEPDGKHLIFPPNISIRRIDPESEAFKQKRYFQIFGDLIHLISSAAVQSLIRSSTMLLDEFAAFLGLFTSMNTNKRVTGAHVEYESDTWVTAFNVTIQLGKVCRTLGEAYRTASSEELADGLDHLLGEMGGRQIAFHATEFGGVRYLLVNFSVGSEAVSFHHPLAWLYAEMVKNVEALDSEKLQEVGVESLSALAMGRGDFKFLAAMDDPLRVIVLVAQIRAGLWVRNGFGMRAQQLHYKEYSLRENTYDQDIFFLQTAFVVLDPSLVVIAILDRFHVQEWLGGDQAHPSYEPGQAFAMVEEMLYLLIVLLSDPTNVTGMSSEQCLRREVIHSLCLAPCAYSDLMRRVSEKFSDDPALDRVLADVAHFKLPVGTSDQGVYTLRAECFKEVDPYFPRYSRNQREEAEKVVREQMKEANKDVEPVIVPSPLNVTVGPFVTLTKAFDSDVLLQIIFFSMQHGRSRGALFSEAMVDEALHLSMLALVEKPTSFANFASQRILSNIPGESTLVHLIVKIEEDDRMKSVRHKARWCLDRLGELVGPSVSALRKVEDVAALAAALDVKRLAAKARQAAIMQQFAVAQKTFLDSSENIDDDSDDDEMEGAGPTQRSLGSCIVCQDALDATRAFGSLALIQTSNFVRLTPGKGREVEGVEQVVPDYFAEVLATPSSLDRDAAPIRPFGIASKRIPLHSDDSNGDGLSAGFPQSTQAGLHASGCGHWMHLACFDTYYRSIEQRHALEQTRCHPEDVERKEFICPLCKSLGNVLLPIEVEDKVVTLDSRGLDEWYRAALEQETYFASEDESAADTVRRLREGEGLSRRHDREHFRSDLKINTVGVAPWEITIAMATKHGVLFEDKERLMTARMLDVADSLLQEIGRGGGAATPGYLPSELMAYTVASLEIAARGGEVAVADAIPDSSIRLLKSFFTILADLACIETGQEKSNEIVAHTVFLHLGGEFGRVDTQFLSTLNPLSTLIEISAVLPSAFSHFATLGFYTELVKSLFAIAKLAPQGRSIDASLLVVSDAEQEEYTALAASRLHVPSPSSVSSSQLSSIVLGKLLYTYTLPFLRRAAILHRVLFPTSFPTPAPTSNGTEMTRLLNQLGILDPSSALAHADTPAPDGRAAIRRHMLACYVAMPDLHSVSKVDFRPAAVLDPITKLTSDIAIQAEHPVIYELIGLAAQLDTLTAVSLQRKCRNCRLVPAEPALCLFCGEMVCYQSFCCMDGEDEAQHGECNVHMWTCGGAVGMYYLIKKNMILYLYTNRGAFGTPPYLDSHGEVDLGNRSRNQFPQFLHAGRYDEIRKAWLNHSIPTFVARKLENSIDHGGWLTL